MHRRRLLVLKKVLVVFAIGLFVTALTGFSQIRGGHDTETNNYDCQYGQCAKYKDDGTRCKNCAQNGSPYCWSHRR